MFCQKRALMSFLTNVLQNLVAYKDFLCNANKIKILDSLY